LSPPSTPIAGSAGPERISLRKWFLTYVGWMVLLTGVALVALRAYETGDPNARSIWLVALGVFYLSLCCLFFPAPTVWIVMLLASNEMAVIGPVPLRVAVVAAVCSVATGMANLNEYHIITFLLRYGWVARVRDTRVYRWAARWFGASPFLVVAVFGFLPLPVDVVRWLAILYRYPRLRYFAAYVVGRFPRYLIWSLSAVWLDLSWWQILAVQVVLVAAAGLSVAHSIVRKRRAERAARGELAAAGRIP
jgi:membrane protein YqaA with SNARE-associated domain